MFLRLSILVVFLLVSGTVDSKHKHHQKGEEPAFIKNLTNPQRSSFFGIVKNPGISFQQKEEKLVKWAETNNLSDQYAEFAKGLATHKEQVSKNISSVIDRLAAAKVEVDKINADLSLTKIQRDEKINELKETYPQEIPTIFYIGGLFEHKKNGTKESEGKGEGKGGKRKHQ